MLAGIAKTGWKRLFSGLGAAAFSLVLLSGGRDVPVPAAVAADAAANAKATAKVVAKAPAKVVAEPLGVPVADPFVLRQDDTFYLYGTSAVDGFKVWSSRDLRKWTPRGYAFKRTGTSWGRAKFWAPEVVAKDGKYYMYYTSEGVVQGRHSLRICVAASDSPLGPFTDVAAPMIEIGQAMIDGHVLQVDGRAYLYYSRDCSENRNEGGLPVSEIYVVPLKDSLIAMEEEAKPVLCTRPDQPWEGGRWNEAPFVIRRGGLFILMYSASGYFDPNYSIGYATATSPLGPWKKANGPVLAKGEGVSGPGHNCVVEEGDTTYIVYHQHRNLTGGDDRLLAVSPLEVITGKDGSVSLAVRKMKEVVSQVLDNNKPEAAVVEAR